MKYDVVVIGTGPGGYVCAIRAAQLGLRAAVVEQRATHGGTCLNVGCIPSKALLHASEAFVAAGHMSKLGVRAEGISLDLPAMMQHKAAVVESNVKGVAYLLKKNKVDVYVGIGSVSSDGRVAVAGADGDITHIEASNVVIASGSQPATLPGVVIDEQSVVSSTGALEFDAVPPRLVVVGAGVIGLELGSVWSRLGSAVTVVEYLPRILPGMDGDSSKLMQRLLAKQGLEFKLAHQVRSIETGDDGTVVVTASPVGKDETLEIAADKVLVAIGRKPCTDGLGLEAAGISTDERGRIVVDERFATSRPNVYAIGDVIAGPMLAHKAEEDGVAVAENLAGLHGHVDYGLVSAVVYTEPEFAAVGASEEQLREAGVDYRAGVFPFMANGRAKAMASADGQVKLLADAKSDRLLGAHIIGHGAGELIQELVTAMAFKASAEDIALTCHAHPTMSEAVREAALAVDSRAIHI